MNFNLIYVFMTTKGFKVTQNNQKDMHYLGCVLIHHIQDNSNINCMMVLLHELFGNSVNINPNLTHQNTTRVCARGLFKG